MCVWLDVFSFLVMHLCIEQDPECACVCACCGPWVHEGWRTEVGVGSVMWKHLATKTWFSSFGTYS